MGFGRIVFGTVLVAGGLVLLAAQFGYLPSDIAHPLVQLWPLLLVAFGLALLANALKSSLLGWLAVLLVVGGVAYGAFWMSRRPAVEEAQFSSTVDLDRAGITSLTLRTQSLGGRLDMDAATSAKSRLLGIAVSHVAGEEEAGHLFRVTGHAGLFLWPADTRFGRGAPVGAGLQLAVPRSTPIRLDGTCRFASSRLSLERLKPERIAMKLVGSRLDLRVGDQGRPADIAIRGYLSTIRLRVPGDCPVRLSFTSRFTTRSVPTDFVEHAPGRGHGHVFTAEGRGAPIVIRIEGPLLHVTVEREPLSAV